MSIRIQFHDKFRSDTLKSYCTDVPFKRTNKYLSFTLHLILPSVLSDLSHIYRINSVLLSTSYLFPLLIFLQITLFSSGVWWTTFPFKNSTDLNLLLKLFLFWKIFALTDVEPFKQSKHMSWETYRSDDPLSIWSKHCQWFSVVCFQYLGNYLVHGNLFHEQRIFTTIAMR